MTDESIKNKGTEERSNPLPRDQLEIIQKILYGSLL